MGVKILIDSASDINLAEAQQMGIEMIPMEVRFGEEEFLDGVNLLPEQFYQKLKGSKVLPKTSQINEFRWQERFEELTKNGDELIVITISSKLSGTYNSACQAAKNFAGKVFVVDSFSAAIGERLLCQYALKLINQGKSPSEVAQILDAEKHKVQVMAMVDTLEYLKKGGRISAVVAFAGTLLSIKPIVAMVDGEVKLIGKAIGAKNAISQLNKIAQEKVINFDMPCGVIWAGLDKTVPEKYINDSQNIFEGKDIKSFVLGGTIGTHVGPGAIGVAFFKK